MRKVDYVAPDGQMRRVGLPEGTDDYDPQEGIPLDMYAAIDGMYADAQETFRVRLWDALWRRGLIEPADYLTKDAPDKARSALLETLRFDALDLIAKAKESTNV